MTIEDLKNHCEKQIDLCSKLNDYKHLEEHQIILNLIKENKELKEKYENAVADYETTMAEKNELKKQVEERTKMYQNAYDYSQKMEGKAIILEAQQKEFINYLEDEIKNTQIKWGNKLTEKGYIDIAMTVRAYQIILQKYKEIIGVLDENNKQ